MVSCVDTVLLPDDKTVDEDFWKTKDEVAQMVNGAYHSMLSADVINRLIVWGDFRSDELKMVSIDANATVNALTEIDAVNIPVTKLSTTATSFSTRHRRLWRLTRHIPRATTSPTARRCSH